MGLFLFGLFIGGVIGALVFTYLIAVAMIPN